MDARRWTVAIVLVLAAAGAFFDWTSRNAGEAPGHDSARARPSAEQPAASAPALAPVPAEPLSAPVVADPLRRDDVRAALEAFLGQKTVGSYLQADDFARRLVATVDNLARDYAPASRWPVQPTPGRFTVDEGRRPPGIALDNSARYAPLVLLAETIDADRAAQLYLRMYPVLQDEYRQLGFPSSEFNERLLDVIKQMLAAPEPDPPPEVQLVEVKGSVESLRPWVRYEFVDPSLEALPAGQKILVRVGLVNERRLKKKLAEFRDALVARLRTAAVAAPAPAAASASQR